MDAVIVDPEVGVVLDAMPLPSVSNETLGAMREMRKEMFAGLAASLSDHVERSDHVVDAETGVFVRVHRPKGIAGLLPCVYSMHGGGYVLGSLDMDDLRFDRWCQEHRCVGVSVEYRLAPETPYPGPLEDCYAGLRWTYDNAAALGIDQRCIGVAGISAGGGLAAALSLLARDRGEVPLAFSLLECPMIDDRQTTSSSQLDGLAIWSRESNTFGWRSYLGAAYGSTTISQYAAASRADDLSGLPPTMIIVGGADGFRDENIEYAARLVQSGVAAELHVLPGAPHGVQMFVGTRLAHRWDALVVDWLVGQLDTLRNRHGLV